MAYTKVIVIGAGFGGLNCALGLEKADADVSVIDRTNHHLFQPLLYQIATCALSPGDIAVPIREVLHKQKNTTCIMGNVEAIDKEKREVHLSNGDIFNFDYLVVATGARHSYFGHDEWEKYAPGLKTLPDALRIRERILLAFEIAERCDSLTEREKYLRFVIVGGGPTGVELAGAVAEIAHKTLMGDFRHIHPDQAQIYLIEGQPEVLKTFDPKLGHKAHHYLEKMGVQLITGTHASDINSRGVWVNNEFLESFNIIWAAGNHASPLLETLDVPLDKARRAIVGPDLSIPDYPNIFVIGDSCSAKGKNGKALPGLAPVAIQQGRYIAKIITKQTPPEKRKPFKYFDKGTMATVGKAKAVLSYGKIRMGGFIAWLAWCFIHVFFLVSFRNRFIVLYQWLYMFITNKRQVRIIKKPIFGGEDSIFSKVDNDYHVRGTELKIPKDAFPTTADAHKPPTSSS